MKLKPESSAAHYNFATALTLAGRLDEAVGQYRLALQIRPDYALAHNNLGSVLLRLGNSAEALQHFREALRLDPANAEAHYNVGSLFRARGRFSEALGPFREAVRLKPDWLPAVTSLAWLLATVPDAALRDANQAIRLAERGVDLSGRGDPVALDVLAAAYAAAGDFDRAVATAQAALELKPAEPDATEIHQRQDLYRQRKPYVLPADRS